MDFGKSFVFMFQDPRWFRKLLIGTLLLLAGILFSWLLIGLIPLIFVLGWAQVTLRNVLDGREHPMPEWDEWGDFFMRGLKLLVALLVWLLPILILFIPMGFGSALLGERGGAQSGGWALVVCASCLMLLWGIFVALISPAIYVRLAAFDRFSAAFEVGELWAFTRDNIGNVILAILLLLLASWIAVPIIGLLGLIVCLVGVLISIPFSSLWQSLLTAHLYGQIGAYGNRPVRTPVPEPVPSLPSEYHEEAAPAEGLTAPEEPAAPLEEPAPVEAPAPEAPETPVEPPITEEQL